MLQTSVMNLLWIIQILKILSDFYPAQDVTCVALKEEIR